MVTEEPATPFSRLLPPYAWTKTASWELSEPTRGSECTLGYPNKHRSVSESLLELSRGIPRGAPAPVLLCRESSGCRYLWAVPFDPERLEALGPPTPIVEGVSVNPNALAHFAVGADLLFYHEGQGSQDLVPLWLGRDGSEQLLDPALTELFETPAFSPDGGRVALQRQIGGELEDI